MDVLAPTTMKNAAKCDTSCDTQIFVSHQNFERNLRFPGSMSVGVSVHPHHKTTWLVSCEASVFATPLIRESKVRSDEWHCFLLSLEGKGHRTICYRTSPITLWVLCTTCLYYLHPKGRCDVKNNASPGR